MMEKFSGGGAAGGHSAGGTGRDSEGQDVTVQNATVQNATVLDLTVQDLIAQEIFEVVNLGNGLDRTITTPFCCDLLSIAMSRAAEGCAWVTVMGNINTLAVAALTDAACVILAEGVSLDAAAAAKAEEQGITVLKTELPVFDGALEVYQLMHKTTAGTVQGIVTDMTQGTVPDSTQEKFHG